MSLARTAANTAPRAPATPTTPSTPSAQADQSHTPGGSWKHPKFDEIARRQYATTFDERNVRAVVANGSLLFLSVYGNAVTSKVKLLEYAAYVPFLYSLIGFLLTWLQHANQHSRPGRSLQRVGYSTGSPCICCEHHLRVSPAHPPLLPRRHRRHSPHALAARVHGLESRRTVATDCRRCIRIPQLCHTAAIPAIHTAQQQLQQPRPRLAVTLVWQPARRLRSVHFELALFAKH
jgi:hypothetical protein